MVEPEYVEPARVMGELIVRPDRLGWMLDVGVRLRRGLSVGGRGAGPGFMNCPEV